MERIIGIDFGTSTTYMNVKRYNGAQPDGDKFSYIPVMFNYGESSGYVATIVRENADGSFDFGEKASEQLEGAKIHTEIKMRLESPDEQERAAARRITREFFKFLHEQYAQQAANLGGTDDKEETVVSYPVKWQKETAQFMLDAARDAGFQNVRGMDEAEAAVATVLCQNSGNKGLIYADKPGYLMLIDMGAGTTDLVVCRYEARTNGEIAIELVASWPHSADEPTFGGREIDAVLEQYVANYLTESLLNQSLLPIAQDFATKPGESKKWKERHVSVNLADGKPVITCGYVSPLRSMLSTDFPAFDRAGFEVLIESGLRDYARLISGCLEKTAEVDKNFSVLDLVILTGGHSAWYFAREILNGAMEGWVDHPALAAVRENPYRVVSLPNPQTTVSLGLVYSKLPFDLWKQTGEEEPVEEVETPRIEEIEDDNLPTDNLEEPATGEQEQTATAAAGTVFCPACGAVAKAGANFCTSCGSALDPLFKRDIPDKKPDHPHSNQSGDFYCRKTKEYLRSRFYELDNSDITVTRSRKELKISPNEEMLFIGEYSGDGIFVLCALAENGFYLRNGLVVGRVRYLSWKEFVDFEWKYSILSEFKNDTVSIIVSHFGGSLLQDVHTYLRSLSSQTQSVQPPAEPIKPVEPVKPQPPVHVYTPVDRSKCPNCGTPYKKNERKCSVCGRKARTLPTLPFKMNMISWIQGESKLNIAQATGTMTILEDRLEFRRLFGNTMALFNPATAAYSAAKAVAQPKDILWMRDITDAYGNFGKRGPSLTIHMISGEKHTFTAQLNNQVWQETMEDALDLIQMRIRKN